METYSARQRAEARASILNSQDNGWIVVELENGFGVKHDGTSKAPVPKASLRWCSERTSPYRFVRPVLRLKAC